MRSARGVPPSVRLAGVDPAVDVGIEVSRVVEADRDLQVRNAADQFLILERRPRPADEPLAAKRCNQSLRPVESRLT